MNRHIKLIIVLLGVVYAFPAGAQNNPYKINDELYAKYRRVMKYRTDSCCVPMSDSLYEDAVRLGDKKAACIALTISDILGLYSIMGTPSAVLTYTGFMRVLFLLKD